MGLSVIISCLGSTKSALSVKSFVIYHSVESTSREVRSGFPEELIYAHYLTLVAEALEGFKKRVRSIGKEAWKGALKSKELQVKVKKRKMMIISENEEGKFLCNVSKNGVSSNSTPPSFLDMGA